MDFMTCFSQFVSWKSDNYDAILVISDQVKKIAHFELVNITIYTSRLAKVII